MPQAAFLRAPTSYGSKQNYTSERFSWPVRPVIFWGYRRVAIQMRGPQLTLSGTTLTLRAVGVSEQNAIPNSLLGAWTKLKQEVPQTTNHPSWKVPENQKSNHQALLPSSSLPSFFHPSLTTFLPFSLVTSPSLNTRPLLAGGPRLCPVGFPQPNVNELRQGFHWRIVEHQSVGHPQQASDCWGPKMGYKFGSALKAVKSLIGMGKTTHRASGNMPTHRASSTRPARERAGDKLKQSSKSGIVFKTNLTGTWLG